MYRLVYKITNDTNLIHLVDLLVQGCLVLLVPLVISIYFIFCFVDKKNINSTSPRKHKLLEYSTLYELYFLENLLKQRFSLKWNDNFFITTAQYMKRIYQIKLKIY